MRKTIQGLQEALLANQKAIAAVQKDRPVRYATIEAHRLSVIYTHVQTGALRSSHRMEVYGQRGKVFIDPSAVNPKSGSRPVKYGVIEEARGGGHAFYGRTVEHFDAIGGAAWVGLQQDLP